MNQLTINPELEKNRIVDFLKKTFTEQKISKAVIGLSGGVDSTVSLYLLKEVLPLKNIFAYHLPYNQENTLVNKIVNKLKLPQKNFQVISIKKMVNVIPAKAGIQEYNLDSRLRGNDKNNIDNIRVGNIMSRTRMIILFDQAKKHNALVCGTENRSEHLLGYFTRFGDSASDIEPIQHLYKTQVLELAKYLGIDKEIINQSPTAGLWPGQTDEGEFGFTYQEADQVLHLYFDEKITVDKIKQQGFKNAEKIIKEAKKNEFKLKTPYVIT